MKYDWKSHWHQVSQILGGLPRSTPTEAVLEEVGAVLGGVPTYDALKAACRAHGQARVLDLLGSQERPQTEPAPPPVDTDRVLRVLCAGDIHSPYHDDVAFGVFLSVCRHVRPDRIVLMGDVVDCYPISRFSKNPERKGQLRSELEVTNDLLDQIGSTCSTVDYIEGNHEWRLPRYLESNAPALWGMVEMRKELHIADRGWTWHPYRGPALRIGKMSFKHDLGPAGKYAAHQTLEAYGGNITFGHTHRGSTVYDGTTQGERRVAMNTGWLGDVNAIDYTHIEVARRSYQHGFGIVHVAKVTGNAFAKFVPIVDGTCEVEGRIYGLNGPL